MTTPGFTFCGHEACGLPIILNTDTDRWEHHYVVTGGPTIETVLRADADHQATPDGYEPPADEEIDPDRDYDERML